jgi:hypothetical protein
MQPPVLWPSALNSQHLHFQFPITLLLKILLEVVAIGRKNAGKDPDKYQKNAEFYADFKTVEII